MKTTKAILFAAFMAIVSFGFSQSEAAPRIIDAMPDYQKAVCVQLSTAIAVPGLASAMHSQLNIRMLRNDQQYYILRVGYRNITYYISGNAAEWKEFFSAVIDIPPEG